MNLLSEDSKKRTKAVIDRMKAKIAEVQGYTQVLGEDNDILITSILTMDFFVTSVPFDMAAADRINGEIEIVQRVLAPYEL